MQSSHAFARYNLKKLVNIIFNLIPIFIVTGIGEILLCFANLIKTKPKLRLILVGFGNYREHLEAMLKAFVLGDKELYKAAAFSKDEKGDSFLESSIDVDKYFLKLCKSNYFIVSGLLFTASLYQG